jgi:hypothetical protein
MPFENGSGFSESTPEKQAVVRAILEKELWVVKGSNRWGARMLMLDLTAGPGMYPDGTPGSPVILGDLVARMGMSAGLTCCERDQRNVDALRAAGYRVLAGDHNETVPLWLRRLRGSFLGLAYFDPNKGEPMPLPLFEQIVHGQATKRLDLLITINVSARWRVRGARRKGYIKNEQLAPWLADEIEALAQWKKAVMVHDLFGHPNQFAMVLATNYTKLSAFKAVGFVDAMSLDGQRIIESADRRRHE